MKDGGFTKPAVVAAAVLGGASLIGALVAGVLFGGSPDVTTAGPSAFSVSALGHGALVELLETSGRTVILSRGQSARKAAHGALLVILEPPDDDAALREMLAGVERAFVALPRRVGVEARDDPTRVRATSELPLSEVQRVHDVVHGSGRVRRLDATARWRARPGFPEPTLRAPQVVADPSGPVLVSAATGEALLWHTDGHWFLADPDLVANHGIGDGDNATLVLAAIAALAPPGVPIVVDEEVHGFGVPPWVWGELGRFPLVLLVAQFAGLVAVLLWCGLRRFGSPLPGPGGLSPGRGLLIEHTADLLLAGRHTLAMLERYLRLSAQRVERALHLPPGLPAPERRARLDRIAEVRGIGTRFSDLESARTRLRAASGDDREVLHLAQDIARWRKEMTDGDH